MTDVAPNRDLELPVDRITEVATAALRRAGASEYESDIVARALVAADLRGQHGQGVARLPTIIGRVRAGLILPGAQSVYTQVTPSLAVLDGSFGFGHVTAIDACHRVGELARQSGVGLVTARHTNHIGMLAYYLERLARDGLVALIFTTTDASVRPAGGADPVLGANPMGVGFPADPPFVLDMSTAATTVCKLMSAQRRGHRIPPTWAVDESGSPTDDPATALRGAVNSVGGVKGYGLGLAVSLLAGALTGTATGARVHGTSDSRLVSTNGNLFAAIDPRYLPWGDEVTDRASSFLHEVRLSRRVEPSRPVLVPGDRGRARAEAAEKRGRLRISRRLWSTLSLLAEGRTG